MSLNAHMSTLTKRHQDLEAAIAEESKHPAFDETRVNEMKRQKLRIKDQLKSLKPED